MKHSRSSQSESVALLPSWYNPILEHQLHSSHQKLFYFLQNLVSILRSSLVHYDYDFVVLEYPANPTATACNYCSNKQTSHLEMKNDQVIERSNQPFHFLILASNTLTSELTNTLMHRWEDGNLFFFCNFFLLKTTPNFSHISNGNQNEVTGKYCPPCSFAHSLQYQNNVNGWWSKDNSKQNKMTNTPTAGVLGIIRIIWLAKLSK